jgi:cytochrome c
MDSFELNKILGALLGTCLILLALNITAEALFTPPPLAKAGYEIAAVEKTETGGKPEAKAPEEPIEKLLASANPERGEQTAKPCATCHTFTKGGPNKIGPNLWGVVGRAKGSGGFAYSDALKSKGGNWTVDDLSAFLASPRAYAPGTKMSFAGLPKGSDRANVIAYLNTLSDNPAPLPKAAEAPGGTKSQ